MSRIVSSENLERQDVSLARLVEESDHNFRIDSRIYTDPSVFQEEMRWIFDKTWVYVGHVSEIPHGGDFKTAMIGSNPVIVTRAEDGSIHVMANECRHRGNAICRESHGTTRNFVCPYHGWVYSLTGELTGVTHPKGYPPNFARELGGLEKCRSAIYRGLIFASFDQRLPPIEEHLGGIRKYIDWWADLSPEPEFHVTRPHHYSFTANWKLQVENGHDSWHSRFTHESAFATVEKFGGRRVSERGTGGVTRAFDGGYGLQERAGIRQGLSNEQLGVYKDALHRRHSDAAVEDIWTVRHIFVFPNLFLFDNLIRVIQPVAVDRTVVVSYPLLLTGVPDELNLVRLAELEGRLGTTGMVSADDLEIFCGNQTGMNGTRRSWLILSHGMMSERQGAGSEIIGDDTSETPQRSIYRQWRKLMSAAARSEYAGKVPT